ncbi:MAG: helix-turn-helix transcriptional regulator [Sedimentisphaerales bacterium]|nr:helix-turn-helix transcriptional regulator [Sedimentisphaerales bacterium]
MPHPVDVHVGKRIRHRRWLVGMTQQQLADKAGVTRQTIIAIESGRYAPSLPLAFKIAHTFGISIEDVFQYENEQ